MQEAILRIFADTQKEIHCTTHGGHAKVLAQIAVSKEYSNVIAIGGDGTVNEILQVIAGKNIKLGVVPLGSGNGLARHCKIPLDTDEALQVIKEGANTLIDVGIINDVYFISNAGVAFDAWVCHQIEQSTKRGLKMYVQFVFKNFFSYKSATYHIETDNESFSTKAYFLNAANGKEFGYGFELASEASLKDGLLDLILVKKINLWSGLVFVWQGWRGKLKASKNVLLMKSKSIRIRSNNMQYFQTDGDTHKTEGKCEIRIVPSYLNLIIPANLTHSI